MVRRSAALLIALVPSLPALVSGAGCGGAEAPPANTSAGVDYGPNKIPPADQVARKPGRAGPSPGRPPAR